jgi:hypothetical protein
MQASHSGLLGPRTASTLRRFTTQRRGAAACRPLSHRRVVAYSSGNAATTVREAVLCKKFKAHDASTSAALVVTDEPGEAACSARWTSHSCKGSGLTSVLGNGCLHRPEEGHHLVLGQDPGHMDAGRGEQQLQLCMSWCSRTFRKHWCCIAGCHVAACRRRPATWSDRHACMDMQHTTTLETPAA